MSGIQAIDRVGFTLATDGISACSVDRVRKALEASQLDPELCRDLAKRFCFARAKNKLRDAGLITEVAESDSRWVWQLSDKYLENQQMKFSYKAQFWFEKSTESVGSDHDVILDQVQKLFAEYGGLYLPSDITKLVTRIFNKQNGIIPLRHAGGYYFIPESHRDLIEKVDTFIRGIGAKSIICAIGTDATSVKDQALSMLTESVQKQVAAMVKEVEEFKAAPADSKAQLTGRVARNRIGELQNSINKIEDFAKSLQVSAKDIIQSCRTKELDIALLVNGDTDVIAALAQSGSLNGTLGALLIAANELPVVQPSNEKIQIAELLLQDKISLPSIKELAGVGAEVTL